MSDTNGKGLPRELDDEKTNSKWVIIRVLHGYAIFSLESYPWSSLTASNEASGVLESFETSTDH
jgi:hypothetical protein